ncbi:4Fe-4S dicluster domain-containing protein [Ectothiorhodospira lacustris]|uniref:4Fe-4S dicluster domain-containing protein n=1 Tax=Ectothiorhodospira lacustris TaxID=2899127 RepID=UPI001EE8D850|nr:4Fe-4S dicluster domain-containing protein [Ectothiorhodospira lacustris]MCG5500049.1 4Fe-4S dicluster domain-containing protein [Ectothiorhodospira lacustris]
MQAYSSLPVAVHRTLHPARGLQLAVMTCQTLSIRLGGCDACVRVCPVQALRPSSADAAPEPAEGCTGCGRCVAACPMGALSLEGVGSEASPATHLECEQVPPSARLPRSRMVPCLGGLDAAALIHAHRLAGEGPRLVDRGLCAHCPSGGGAEIHPSRATLDQARHLLETMGVPLSHLPRLQSAPAPGACGVTAQDPSIPDASRRAFLGRLGLEAGRLMGHTVPAMSLVSPATGTASLTAPPALSRVPSARPSDARLRLLNACLELARQQALPMPHGLFSAMEVGDDCRGHGVCSSVCPTGALFRRQEESGSTALIFDPCHCIGCGACERACPEQALRIEARQDDDWRLPEVLREFGSRTCRRCGSPFQTLGDESECVPCARSQAFARSLFRQMAECEDSARIADPCHPPEAAPDAPGVSRA